MLEAIPSTPGSIVPPPFVEDGLPPAPTEGGLPGSTVVHAPEVGVISGRLEGVCLGTLLGELGLKSSVHCARCKGTPLRLHLGNSTGPRTGMELRPLVPSDDITPLLLRLGHNGNDTHDTARVLFPPITWPDPADPVDELVSFCSAIECPRQEMDCNYLSDATFSVVRRCSKDEFSTDVSSKG